MASAPPTGERLSSSPSTALFLAKLFRWLPSDSMSAIRRTWFSSASALEVVRAGLCDALASDYHYPSPRRAALGLIRDHGLGWDEGWGLVSSGPARVMGMQDRGTLAPGMRADLVILDATTLRVAATLSGGRASFMSGDVAARLLAA